MAKPTPRRAPRGAAVVPPHPQTLRALPTRPRRRPGFPPRFTLPLGARIGEDCTVIGHLSAGRIAELYQVWSATYLCALTCKILLPPCAPYSPAGRGLKREATLLRRLAHPNIVRLFGQGLHDQRAFLLQEYLHGPSLNEWLEVSPQQQVPPPEAMKASLHICAALAHLHAQGYVHRDIKPANVLLRGGIPVLIDFDVAYRLRPGHTPRECIGTDPYMAPEQCVQAELSPATDIYSVGVLLYELVTGRWPFEDALLHAPEQKTLAERYPQTRGGLPPRPRRFNAQITRRLEAVIMQCVAPTPTQRFPSARALAQALVGCLDRTEQLWPESLDVHHEMI